MKDIRIPETDIVISKREQLATIFIVAFLLSFGLLISNAIINYSTDKKNEYLKAFKTDIPEEFVYGMKTNLGNAFIYGELKAVDAISLDELDGKYISVEKVKEKYTRHTRTVTVRTGKTTTTRTEVYYTWDTVHTDLYECNKISFCGEEFPVNKIVLPDEKYLTTIYETLSTRYVYYVRDYSYMGTVYTILNNNTIADDTPFIEQNLNDTVDYYVNSTKMSVYLFWIGWILGMIFLIVLFWSLENKWLEG